MKSNVTSLSVCLSAYINLLCNFHILSFAFDLSSSLPVTVFRRPHFLCSIFECGKYKTWYTISTTLSPHSLKFLSCLFGESRSPFWNKKGSKKELALEMDTDLPGLPFL